MRNAWKSQEADRDVIGLYRRVGCGLLRALLASILVATVAGEVVGMGALFVHADGDGEIKRMRVDPGHQGGGIGTALLERLEAAAGERGVTRLFLDTTEQQSAARHLYASSGYVEEARYLLGKFRVIKYAKPLA